MNLNLTVNGKMRNYIFAAAVAVTFMALVTAFLIGAGQDQYYRSNYAHYQQAIKLMGNRQYAEALQSFQGLDAESQNSFQVQYMEAFCAAQNGDFSTAAALMGKARETRPALLQDPKYLERYGMILYKLGDYEPARLYLQESMKYPGEPAIAQEAQRYLTEIDKKLGTGGRP